MDQFKVANHLKNIVQVYPAAADVVVAAKHGDKQARHALARLWLSEGFPRASRGHSRNALQYMRPCDLGLA